MRVKIFVVLGAALFATNAIATTSLVDCPSCQLKLQMEMTDPMTPVSTSNATQALNIANVLAGPSSTALGAYNQATPNWNPFSGDALPGSNLLAFGGLTGFNPGFQASFWNSSNGSFINTSSAPWNFGVPEDDFSQALLNWGPFTSFN